MSTHLGGLLHVLGVVLLDVVPGADGRLQLVPYHHAWSLGGGAADEGQDTSPRVGERTLGGGGEAGGGGREREETEIRKSVFINLGKQSNNST